MEATIATQTPNFCRSCGTRLPLIEDIGYCPGCGTPVVPPPPPVPAGFGRRMVGLTIDWLVLGILVSPIAWWFSSMPTTDRSHPSDIAGAYVVTFVLYLSPLYYWVPLTRLWRGQTVGRRLAGTRVALARDGGPVGYWPALGRTLLIWALMTGLIPVMVDLVLPLFGRRRQSLCDRATGTVVTRERSRV
jgi:uncharacterized RDD family membrane protein YckC